ncbi:hypothetical protein ACLB2K_012786 [Fragaria x ananassa]
MSSSPPMANSLSLAPRTASSTSGTSSSPPAASSATPRTFSSSPTLSTTVRSSWPLTTVEHPQGPQWLSSLSQLQHFGLVEESICKFAKKGLTPSQIGVILRYSHGFAQMKSVTGGKILRILKAQAAGSWVRMASK